MALTLADERAAQLRSAHEAAQRGHEGALQELRSAMEAAWTMRVKEAKLHAEATVANLQRDVQVGHRQRCGRNSICTIEWHAVYAHVTLLCMTPSLSSVPARSRAVD